MLKYSVLSLWLVFNLLLSGCSTDGGSSSSSTPASQNTVASGFTVSGRILVPSNTVVDSDVNSSEAAFRSNNSLAEAQSIPNPVMLGGYVNQPNQGAAGRSRQLGDVVDSYLVTLRRGDLISVFVAADNRISNDLELVLLSTNGTVIDASTNRGSAESLQAFNSGLFIIQVQAFRGASNYVLSIGQSRTASLPMGLRLTDDFVAGEVSATWLPQVGLQAQAVHSLAASLGLKHSAGTNERRMLFELEASASRALSLENSDWVFTDATQRLKFDTLIAAKNLSYQPAVASASPNYYLHATAKPNDPLYQYQWHYPFVNLPEAWDITTGSRSVIVAVLDTGVLLNHPDLSGKLVGGYDFIRNAGVALDGNGIDNNPDDPGDAPSTGNSSFHGTHVAGIIAANSNNGIGVTGIGWETRVMPLRVLGRAGNGTDYDIEQAVLFAAGLPNDSGTVPAQRADIINLSLGGPRIASSFQAVVDAARQAGVIVVAAAGNDGNSTVTFPASLRGVISVSAVTINRQRAAYSNFNSSVDIAAPGGDNLDLNGDGVIDGIVSTLGDDSQGRIRPIFAPLFGTSMATPHVAGILALMKAVNPALTPANMDALISQEIISVDLGTAGKDNQFGYGLINAKLAVNIASQLNTGRVPAAAAQLSITPAGLNFGLANSSLSIHLSNQGSGLLRLTQVTEDSTGRRISLLPTAVDGNGLGTYSVNLNRNGLESGTYSANLTISSTTNSVTIPLVWQVSNGNLSGDAGRQFVLLVDPNTLESVLEDQIEASNGIYHYSFRNVPAGDYLIISGSDNNNDKFVCDSGESCGAFPLLSRYQRFTVNNANLSNLNFDVNFNTDFLSGASAQSAVNQPPIVRGIARPDQQRAVSQR